MPVERGGRRPPRRDDGRVDPVSIVTKRIYAPQAAADGYRVLVDRLWPRGVSKASAALDLWLRDIAPSTDLRKWYGHDVARWPEFVERYRLELDSHGDLLRQILDLENQHGVVTLLYAARDETHNEATVLADALTEAGRGPNPS
jgi:uncharacterized protein YeaO (DUF488 family)